MVSWLSVLAAAVILVMRFSYKQARALIWSGSHEHVFLGLRCASDSELAAAKVKHSVAIRVTSPGYLQLVSTRRPLHRLLRIRKAYDVVADIWVSIETGDLAMTYKFVDSEEGVLFSAERLLIGMQRPSQSLVSRRPSPCSNQTFQQPQ